MPSPQYDVVLYGATGFTGRHAAAHMERFAPDGVRWALAGRSREKLEALAQGFKRHAGIIVADSSDPPSVDAMVASTRVLLSTAGPFALYGEPVIAACARSGVDYVDITGEVPFLRRMIDRYHQRAVDSRARIIPCCGFDSIPSDLGTLMLVQALRHAGQGCAEVKAFFLGKGGFSGGSLATALHIAGEEDEALVKDPFLLNPRDTRPPDDPKNADLDRAILDPDLGGWAGPFFMAPVNTRVVRRSAALAQQYGNPYGGDFRYWEAMGPLSQFMARGLSGGIRLMTTMGRLRWARELAARFAPAPGEGPSDKVMDAGFMRVRLFARGTSGLELEGELFSEGDPAIRVTVKMVCESALALVLDRARLPGGSTRGGVLTPATGLGLVVVDRLRAAGIRMETRPRRQALR